MKLIDLWDRLLDQVDEEARALAAEFREHIERLSKDLAPYVPIEFPKWVDGVVVDSPDQAQPAVAENTGGGASPSAPQASAGEVSSVASEGAAQPSQGAQA